MLFLPWRDEDKDLLGNYPTYKEHYDAMSHILQPDERRYDANGVEIDEAFDQLNTHGPPETVWPTVAPNIQHVADEDSAHPPIPETLMEEDDLRANEQLLTQEQKYNAIFMLYRRQRDPTLLSNNEYNSMMMGLNTEQLAAVCHHQRWSKTSLSHLRQGKTITPYHLFISGPGGVGKSHVIKLIQHDTIRLLKKSTYFEQDSMVVLLTAPTGTAAFAIDGMTYHAALGFSLPGAQLSGDKLNSMRTALAQLQVLIIDEISMVGSDSFQDINDHLQLIKQNEKPFGNVTVILVGDMYQLQTVNESFIFQGSSNVLNNIVCPDNIFFSFSLLELTEIMQQKDDKQFAEMLSRLRIGETTPADIEELQAREMHGRDILPSVAYAFSTNKKVQQHNNKVLQTMDGKVFTVRAIDSTKDLETGQLENAIDPDTVMSKTGNLPTLLKLCKGALIMITTNIDVADGLVNGSMGTVVDVVEQESNVVFLLVRLKNAKAGSEAKRTNPYHIRYPGTVLIKRAEVHFPIARSSRSKKGTNVKRRQFPVTLAWGCTIHKMQGMTVEKIVVDMSGKLHPGQAYVAFSRVESLSGLHIMNFDHKKITHKPAVALAMEKMERLPISHQLHPQEDMFAVGHINARGYTTHQTNIIHHPFFQHLDCLCVSETHFLQSLCNHDVILPWKEQFLFRADRSSQGGSVMISGQEYRMFNSNQIHCITEPIEMLTIHILIADNSSLYITVIYRRPMCNSKMALEAITRMLSMVPHCSQHIVLGDFNEDLLSPSKTPINDFMLTAGFDQHVDGPTTNYGSLLDHIYT